MTTFTPTKATGSHFYRYQSAEHLNWLKTIILEHLLYLPSVAQLNDPTDCRPKIAPMSEEEMVTFLRNDYIVSGERTTSCVVCASVAKLRHDTA